MVVVMVACNPGYIITFVNSIVHGAVVIVNFRCEVAVGRTMSKMYNKNKLIDYWSWTSNLVFEWIELTLVRHSTYNSISYLRDRCRVRCVYQPTLHLMDTYGELGFTLFKREKEKNRDKLMGFLRLCTYAGVECHRLRRISPPARKKPKNLHQSQRAHQSHWCCCCTDRLGQLRWSALVCIRMPTCDPHGRCRGCSARNIMETQLIHS